MPKSFSRARIAYFKSLLEYQPHFGLFRWKESRRGYAGKAKAGAIAGTLRSDGYVAIGIDGTTYRAHVLAWWFMTGLPVPRGKDLDHKNQVRSDNRWSNLRLKDRSGNNHNADPQKSNKSGVKGVSWVQSRNKWDARITVNGHVIVLGRYADFRDAVAARLAAEQQYLGEIASKPLLNPRYKPHVTVHTVTAEQRKEAIRKRSLSVRSTNTTGCPGVGLHRQSGLWYARIVIDYKQRSLGYFKTFEEAVAARKQAEQERFGKSTDK
jgi:hypothetical protein